MLYFVEMLVEVSQSFATSRKFGHDRFILSQQGYNFVFTGCQLNIENKEVVLKYFLGVLQATESSVISCPNFTAKHSF